MSKQEYNKEQIEKLKNNKYVKNCTSKYITFTDEFKVKALELDKRHFLSKEIFKEFEFPDYVINSDIPKGSLKRWRRLSKNEKLIWNRKWRKKVEKVNFDNMTKDEKIEYLETENAYLKELHKKIYWHYP